MLKNLPSTQFKTLKLFKRGKVRDVYDLGEELLLVSTDRISCFDVVLPDCVPYKGVVLTQLSAFWFDYIKDVIPHHLISVQIEDFPKILEPYEKDLNGRAMLAKKAQLIPFECVVRGYLSGSGWKEYQQTSSICGIQLPKGLRESDRLPEPIFTPATKEEQGHDMNVSQDYVDRSIGKELAEQLKNYSIAIYKKASAFAEKKGIIIADTKFEFGTYKGNVILIDEALTPDSSRFWPKASYKPGVNPPSFDKQFVRDYLETLDWDKTYPGPQLPQDILEETSRKYLEIYKLLTGKSLP